MSRTGRLPDGASIRLTPCVLPDYLGIGSDDDFLLIPMGLPTALAVAARYGTTLTTRRMVDLIYAGSRLRLQPQPLPAGGGMRSTACCTRHNHLVRQQGARAAGAADLVSSPRLRSHAGRQAIHGWHRHAQVPIQPLGTVHGAAYADYRHGVRLAGQVVCVDGRPRSIFDVLSDPALSGLPSDGGPRPAPPSCSPAPVATG